MSKWDADNLNAPHSQRHLDEIPQRTAPTVAQMEASTMARAIAAVTQDAAAAASAVALAFPACDPVTLTYRNWRGQVAERTIIPRRVWFGSTAWHHEPQWLLTAWDKEKNVERDFALKDFGRPAASVDRARDLLAEWLETPTEGDPMIDVLLGVIRAAHFALEGGEA